MNKYLLLLSFLAFTCHAEEITKKSYTQEQLITVRQNALNHAMEVLKDKKPAPEEILRVAKEFEAYMLADDLKKVIEQVKQEASPNDFEKVQQPKVNIVSNEDKTSFSGLSIGINGQFKSTTAKVKAGDYGIDGLGQQNFITNLQADYEFKIDNKWGVLLGAAIDFNDNDLLNARGARQARLDGGVRTYDTIRTVSATEKNHYSLFVAPTYRLSSDTSGYLKLAYHNSKIEHSNNFNYSQGTKSLHGYGVGIGVRSYLTKNIFANLEIQRIMYSDDSFFLSNLGTGSTVGSFGLGYSLADDRKQPFLAENSKGKFNGLSLGVNGLLKSSSIKTETTIGGTAHNIDSVGQQNLGIGMFGDYAFRVSDRALFLLGGTYDFNDSDIVKVYGRMGSEVNVKEKKHYSLFVAPAYQLSESSLGYIKLAYHQTKFENINTLDAHELGTANSSYTKKFSGYGVGVGFRTLIADNFYGNLEVQRVFYSRENVSPVAFDADSTIGSLGLSYKF
jgi:hypothetical protein